MRMLRAVFLIFGVALTVPQPAAAQQSSNPPYTLQEVLQLVQGGFSTARIIARIGSDCISFRASGSNEAELRRAGADSTLAPRLRADVRYCAPPSANTPPPAQGVLDIVGELPQGWMRVVNELPPNENRRITLTPGRPATVVVSAPGWCPETLELTMQAAEQRNWTPVLRPRPWVGPC